VLDLPIKVPDLQIEEADLGSGGIRLNLSPGGDCWKSGQSGIAIVNAEYHQ